MINHRKIAKLLVKATEQVMIPLFKEWVESKSPNVKLHIEMGTGKSTYHQKIESKKHKIVFGIKMVREQTRSEFVAAQWTHGKEILNRGYFNKNMDVKNVLVAVLLHEFSHFIQTIIGGRTYNSVHNAKFYQILDRMYEKGYDKLVMNFLLQDKDFIALHYEDNKSVETATKYNRYNLRAGMKMKFKGKEKIEITGTILKVNPKRVELQVPGGVYRVPYHMIMNAWH